MHRQCENDAAMVNCWRNATKESELTLASYESSLRIAREELVMMEGNFHRVQDENKRLKAALKHADDIVYGQSCQGTLNSVPLQNRKGEELS